jgi:hypothetical protein
MSNGAQLTMSAVIGGTAKKLGDGKFANGAVTGAYVMMFNHLQEQIKVNNFRKKYFGHVEGLRNLYIDKVPENYELHGDVFKHKHEADRIAAGVTVGVGDGLSDVYLSPYALENAFALYEVLGHEMIHVAHINHFGARYNGSHSEFSAYSWSIAVHRNLHGTSTEGYKVLSLKIREYKQFRAYNYDKFGFHSNIPNSLWDW